MRIAIIGGGIYGCYLGIKLKEFNKKINLHIYDKENDIFKVAASNNQSRLHLGFHYPRSPETISQTLKGYKLFINDFKNCVYIPNNNLYAIHKKSKIDLNKYIEIYKKYKLNFTIENKSKYKFFKNINDIEGIINTNEGVIVLSKLKKNIKSSLLKNNIKIFLNKLITDIDPLSGNIYHNKKKINKYKYDYIINTTYINPNLGLPDNLHYSIKFEIAAMVLLKNLSIKDTAITIMDGEFISLYPRNQNKYTLSSVKNTPIYKFENLFEIENFYKYEINQLNIKKIISNIIEDSNNYLNKNLKYTVEKKIWLSPKAKLVDDFNDTRISEIKKYNKLFSILCGKIDTVPIIYDKLKKLI